MHDWRGSQGLWPLRHVPFSIFLLYFNHLSSIYIHVHMLVNHITIGTTTGVTRLKLSLISFTCLRPDTLTWSLGQWGIPALSVCSFSSVTRPRPDTSHLWPWLGHKVSGESPPYLYAPSAVSPVPVQTPLTYGLDLVTRLVGNPLPICMLLQQCHPSPSRHLSPLALTWSPG